VLLSKVNRKASLLRAGLHAPGARCTLTLRAAD